MKINMISNNQNFTSTHKGQIVKTLDNGLSFVVSPLTPVAEDTFVGIVYNKKGKLLHTIGQAQEELKDSPKYFAMINKVANAAKSLKEKSVYETCQGTYKEVEKQIAVILKRLAK